MSARAAYAAQDAKHSAQNAWAAHSISGRASVSLADVTTHAAALDTANPSAPP